MGLFYGRKLVTNLNREFHANAGSDHHSIQTFYGRNLQP